MNRIERWAAAAGTTMLLHACGPSAQEQREQFEATVAAAHEACDGVDGSDINPFLTTEQIEGEVAFSEARSDTRSLEQVVELCNKITSGTLKRGHR